MGNVWQLATNLGFIQWSYLYLGEVDRANAIFEELEPLARKLGHWGALSFSLRGWAIDVQGREPNLEEAERFVAEDLEISRLAGSDLLIAQSNTWMGTIHFHMGKWEQGLAELELGSKLESELPGVFTGLCLGTELMYRVYADPEGARRIMDATRAHLPAGDRPVGWGSFALALGHADAHFVLGQDDALAALYPTIRQMLDKGILFRSFGWLPIEGLAGVAAAAAGDWEQAERHFDSASRLTERLGYVYHRPELRRYEAMAWLRRGEPGDGDRARELLTAAIEDYRRIGMPKHVELSESMLKEA
jgi:tetratricopeptide (TPR) repeat protein